jgi:DNA recombination protein Rad52
VVENIDMTRLEALAIVLIQFAVDIHGFVPQHRGGSVPSSSTPSRTVSYVTRRKINADSPTSDIDDEANTVNNEISQQETTTRKKSTVDYIRNPTDYSVLLDHTSTPITIDRMLATKPLRSELMTRPGPGGRVLTYVSGDSVTRSLNDIFGYNNWNLQILRSEKTVCIEVDNPRGNGKLWHVSYSAHVRITHLPSGCFREDIGSGDVMDKSIVVADQNAVKASVTDAMKRTARHFGDKLGNSLYDSEFNIQNAPQTLSEALDLYEEERAQTKFGR